MKVGDDSVPTRLQSAARVEVDGETVLLNSATGALHLLNDAGAAIWSLVDGARTVSAIVTELSAASGAPRDRVAHDVHEFLTRLAGMGLLESADGHMASAPLVEARELFSKGARSSLDTVWVDWYTGQVVGAFRSRGIEVILLKGPAIRRWLYRDAPEQRGYIDADLLVDVRRLGAATAVLTRLGFRPEKASGMESINLFAASWRRDADGAVVNLHRTLHGCEHSTVDPWPILRATAVEDEVSGEVVLLASVPARAVQLVLVSPADRPWRRWDDLGRALEQLPIDGWREAAALAKTLGVDRLFGYRLSQSAGAEALVEHLGLPTAPPLWLRWDADPMLRWVVSLATLPSWRLRLRLARQLVLPSASYVRLRDPEGAAGGLTASYAAWARHVIRLVPGAVVTLWRSLRRARVRG